MSAIESPQKRRGCFFYGCIVAVALAALLVLGVGGVFWYGISRLNATIAQYTDTQPMALPKEELPPAEMAQLKARVNAFESAVDAHSNTPPLVLTGPEINALLAGSPSAAEFKDSFHVSVEGDKLKGQISLPLEKYFKLPFVKTKGRYLNGTGLVKASLTNDQLRVTIDSLEVKGKPLDEEIMKAFRNQNFAANIQQNPTNAEAISKFESIEVKEGRVVITPKKR